VQLPIMMTMAPSLAADFNSLPSSADRVEWLLLPLFFLFSVRCRALLAPWLLFFFGVCATVYVSSLVD
jgi:hypothetical protein